MKGGKVKLLRVVQALRIFHWPKNALIFVPLAMAHGVLDLSLLLKTVAAFFAFGFCASSSYLLNDLFDLEADRGHHQKQFRPFASGALPLRLGLLLAPALLVVSLLIAFQLPGRFLLTLGIYYALALSYTSYFKKMLFLDVLLLAGLYTIRLVAGGFAANVPLSPWFGAFSMFLFLSLALIKRSSELFNLRQQNSQGVIRRAYLPHDMEHLSMMGVASGYTSVLVIALYINSPEVVRLYERPQMLWLICPVLLYWVSRLWIITHRGGMPEDPILFALKDKISYVVGILIGFILFLGS